MIDLSFLNQQQWLIEPNWMRQAMARLRAISHAPTASEVEALRLKRLDAARNAAAASIRATRGKVGVIPIVGPIEQRLSWVGALLGGTSTEEIGAAYDTLLAERSVDRIVFDVDSPGGVSYGVEELSDKIHAGRERKPSYAIANSMAASAGYWIASAASHLSVTPGGDVGSIGVFAMHVDESQAMEAEGVKVTMVTAGKYKAEYMPFAPLATESRDNLQAEVNTTYNRFLNAVKRNRGTSLDDVRRNYGEGRLLNSDQALSVKAVDRVMTFDELVHGLMPPGSSGHRKASAELLRLRHEHRKRVTLESTR